MSPDALLGMVVNAMVRLSRSDVESIDLRDLLLLGGLLLFALVLFAWLSLAPGNGERSAVLTVGGEMVHTFPLSKGGTPSEYSLTGRAGGDIVIRSEGGRIRMLRSDCPDGRCVRTGWIKHPGEAAVCLPNRLVLKVIGSGDTEFDAPSD